MIPEPKAKRHEKYFDKSIVEAVDAILSEIVNSAYYTSQTNTNFIIPRGRTGQKQKGILLDCLRLDSQSMTQWRTHQHGISSEAIRHVFDVFDCFFGEVITGQQPDTQRFTPMEGQEQMYRGVVVWLRKNKRDDVAKAYKLVSNYFLPRSRHIISSQSLSSQTEDNTGLIFLNGDDALNTAKCHSGRINKLDTSLPNGQFISCGDDGHVKFLDVTNLRAGARFKLRPKLYSVQVSPSGDYAACGSTDRTLTIIELRATDEQLTVVPHPAKVADIAISPDSTMVATACDDGIVRVWTKSSDWKHCDQFLGHNSFVRSVNFSTCGSKVISCSADKTAIVWRISDQTATQQFRDHEGWIYEGIFIPNTEFMATCGTDNTVRIWSLEGEEAPKILSGHNDWVTSLDVSPDGTRLLSASRDGTARIWNWQEPGRNAERVRIEAYNERLRCARYTRDGLKIITASTEGRVTVWATPD